MKQSKKKTLPELGSLGIVSDPFWGPPPSKRGNRIAIAVAVILILALGASMIFAILSVGGAIG